MPDKQDKPAGQVPAAPLPAIPAPAAPSGGSPVSGHKPAGQAPTPEGAPLHGQCLHCHGIHSGPFAGRNPGRLVTIVDDTGGMYDRDEPGAEGKAPNVTHGYCPPPATCYDDRMADVRRELAEYRERQRERATQASETPGTRAKGARKRKGADTTQGDTPPRRPRYWRGTK